MKYRKRPIEVDAIRWTGDNLADIHVFGVTSAQPNTTNSALTFWCEKSNAYVEVDRHGWIIAETDGIGHYPCTAEQFAATYEPVDA